MAWEREYTQSYTGGVSKIELNNLERDVRVNPSILKLQARTKLSLRHLEWYGKWNASSLKPQVCAKSSLTVEVFAK